eukprot:4546286-Karenia_brevis.AAC.1
MDCLDRLSAPCHADLPGAELLPGGVRVLAEEPFLGRAARELLRVGIQERVATFRAKATRSSEARSELVRFLESPRVLHHKVWLEVHQALPPRGVVARMARRLEVSLHADADFYGYQTKSAFHAAIKRMKAWYQRGHRLYKAHRPRCR